MGYLLGVLVTPFSCSGFGSFAAAAQWAAGVGREVLLALGAVPDPLDGTVAPPSEATLRRVATNLDAQAFEAVIAAWTATQLNPPDTDSNERVGVAVDGKTVRGARAGQQRAPHPTPPAWPHSSKGTGRSRTASTGSAM